MIFTQARKFAPCYLVFEDLDTIITAGVRSYFFNEVDGLRANDGIFMVGSTNHLDRLDPGIAKRPSRFDRKFYFPDPNEEQRAAYAHFWQGKLKDNEDIEFPDELCKAIAGITDGFSFAYMQEAFVAALLALAAKELKLSVDDAEDTSDLKEISGVIPGSPRAGVPAFLVRVSSTASYEDFLDLKRQILHSCHISWDRAVESDWESKTLRVHGLAGYVVQPLALHEHVLGLEMLSDAQIPMSLRQPSLGDNDGLSELPLWKEIKKQVKILKEEMEDKRVSA